MTETKPNSGTTENKEKKVLSLSGGTTGAGGGRKLELKPRQADAGQVRQSFSHGRSKTVQVEVKRKRAGDRAGDGRGGDGNSGILTDNEREARLRALRGAIVEQEEQATRALHDDIHEEGIPEGSVDEFVAGTEPRDAGTAKTIMPVVPSRPMDPETLRQRELEELRRIEADEKKARDEAEIRRKENVAATRKRDGDDNRSASPRNTSGDAAAARPQPGKIQTPVSIPGVPRSAVADDEEEDRGGKRRGGGGGNKSAVKTPSPAKKIGDDRRRSGKLNVHQVLDEDENERHPSMAARRRAREKERLRALQMKETVRVTRDVTIPDVITVQELASRMAERGADVIKAMMKMGVIATINQVIDADTAELVVQEFGHRVNRVSETDVLEGLVSSLIDSDNTMKSRPPVVTIMGHVDHGKTSLLDALRKTDVVSGEAGGITQHIGAYQVTLNNGGKITFIDTPGHAAFTEMRSRGANVTDIVVLVVAANDGVMPQTIEAISHARAAKVPLIVAINKIDLPDANPDRVRQELLQHEIIVEKMGGDTLDVEVSAKTGRGLERLEEAILLQAEILELRANPDRAANGAVVEAKLDRGRGPVATVLVQGGTLRNGDICVAGSEWGRVRALMNDRGAVVDIAGPAFPVEILGLQGVPQAGDEFVVVENEARAREITEYRQRKIRDAHAAEMSRGSLEQMFSRIKAGETKEMAVVIKGDVHGSIEAIAGSLSRLGGEGGEVKARILLSAVGAITESDITLAKASNAMVIGFNVRANPQARELARREGLELRYYSVIYDVIDDVKAMLGGMLAPTLRETWLGNVDIREVFNITKVGKVGGCYVTQGIVKRGAKVRLLRDNVVIHEGSLKTLKRFKDEVKEVREGFECGMAFENYDDIKVGDVIECFEIESIARTL